MTTPTEERLREAMATLVPEAPATVSDARPVVQRARRRRTAQLAAAAAVVAVVAVGVPAALDRPSTRGHDAVATDPTPAPDPWAAAPCDPLPALSEGFAPADAVAARLCIDRSLPDGELVPVPTDALVTGLEQWRSDLAQIQQADPGRCAAMTILPSPVRMVVELADGSRVLVDPNLCSTVALGGVPVDGDQVAQSFLTALAAQRAALPAPAAPADVAVDCAKGATLAVPVATLAPPVAAVKCWVPPADGPERPMDAARLEILADAFAAAKPGRPSGRCRLGVATWELVTVDAYGDQIRWSPTTCGTLLTMGAGRVEDVSKKIPLDFAL